MQKIESPKEQQNSTIRKPPLTKANTISGVLESPQTGMLAKQFSEENVRPPNQFDSPTEMSRNSVEDENLSSFAIALRKASKEREERILTNQPRMSTTTSRHEQNMLSEEPLAVTVQVHTGGNPITSSTMKQENMTETVNDKVESVNATNSTNTHEVQHSKESAQVEIFEKKLPVSNLIQRFSGDFNETLEATRSTLTSVEKNYKNCDKQHQTASTNTEMKGNSKSVTMIAKVFEGERADDGTYNWRGILKSVSQASVVKSSIPNTEDEHESTNVYDRGNSRQMQGSPSTRKTTKTSLLAKKFEQNSIVKPESGVTKKVEKALQQSLPVSEASTEAVKQVSTYIPEQKSTPPVENGFLKSSLNNENIISPPEEAVVSSAVESLRRKSAVVMHDECDITLQYERNSLVEDNDYWNLPEHTTNLPILSEAPSDAGISELPNETTSTVILPEPELDILPPPITSTDEELALSIENLALPEILPPPEIDDFDNFQDLPPPPLDFHDFCQETPSFDIGNTHSTDAFELPLPSQLPPLHHTDDVDFSSQLPPLYDTDNFELPSPSQLPPLDHTDNVELPSQLPDVDLSSQLPPLYDTDNFELPSPSQLPPPEEVLSDSSFDLEFHDKEAVENKANGNKTKASDEKDDSECSPISSTTAVASATMIDSNSAPPDIMENNECDAIIPQNPSSPSDLSDIPLTQDEEKLPVVDSDQDLSSHELTSSGNTVSPQVCSLCTVYSFVCTVKLIWLWITSSIPSAKTFVLFPH